MRAMAGLGIYVHSATATPGSAWHVRLLENPLKLHMAEEQRVRHWCVPDTLLSAVAG